MQKLYIEIPVAPEITHFSSRQLPGILIVNTAADETACIRLEPLPLLSSQALKWLLSQWRKYPDHDEQRKI